MGECNCSDCGAVILARTAERTGGFCMPCGLRRGVVKRSPAELLEASAVSDDIREQWRELGFWCDVDDDKKAWLFRGSRGGLQSFVRLLRAYAGAPRYAPDGEHEHHGPYSDLILVTTPTRRIGDRAICGPQASFADLADLVEVRLAGCGQGDVVVLGQEWSPESEWRLILNVEVDGWDPALHDPYNT